MISFLRCPGKPVQPGLVGSDLVDNEERRQPVLGLEGGSLSKVTRTGPNPGEGEVCQSIDIHTATRLSQRATQELAASSRPQTLILHPSFILGT